MEFEEQEGQEEEMGIPKPAPEPASYDSLGNSSKLGVAEGTTAAASAAIGRKGTAGVKYRECQKNHAVSFGGHAVDGCCEFIAAGEDGTLEAVICAACNCHRNFHRKEIDGETSPYHHNHHRPQPPLPPHLQQFSPYYHHRGPPYPAGGAGYLHITPPPMTHQHRPLALPAAAASGGGISREEEDMSNPSSSGGGGGGGDGGGGGGSRGGTSKTKRFRTKFTQEQKEKMLAFSEQVGWRIQKHDDAAVEQFCSDTCVKRNVLKVWMHNNKNTLGKKP